jgi:hypothetical protein
MQNWFAQVLDCQRVPGRKPNCYAVGIHHQTAPEKGAVPGVSTALQTLVGLQAHGQLQLHRSG